VAHFSAESVAHFDRNTHEPLKEECRDMRRMNIIDHLAQDVRFALRSLRKTPSFTVPAVLIIALGIGAATAVFSLMNSVLLRPLPYQDGDRIGVVFTLWTRTGEHGEVSTPDYLDWHGESRSFAAIAEYSVGETPVTAGGAAEFAKTAAVSSEFFKVFGAEPIEGRALPNDEVKRGAGGSVVVSRSFWQEHNGPLPFIGGKKDVRLTLYLIQGTVALVLLIACGSVANLLLAKATARVREMAVRAALDASRQRILRQLVTEHLILASVACVAGLFVAYVALPALIRLAPGNVPRLSDTVIDSRVLEFALGASAVAWVILGLASATSAVRVNFDGAQKQGAARRVLVDHLRLCSSLVVAEVALSVVLLTGAGLLIRSFAELQNVNFRFHPENVLIMETSIPSSGVDTARRATLIHERLLNNVALIPGVSSTGASRVPPRSVRSTGSNRCGGERTRSHRICL
jgi:hypothetical protein